MQKVCTSCGKKHTCKTREECKACFNEKKNQQPSFTDSDGTLSIEQRLINLSQEKDMIRPVNTSYSNNAPLPEGPNISNANLTTPDIMNTYYSLFDHNRQPPRFPSTASRMQNPKELQQIPIRGTDGMNEYLDNNMSTLNPPTSQADNNIDRPVTVRDILTIIKPLENKIDQLNNSLNQRMTSVETKNKALENEVMHQKHKNEVLTGIVSDMQRVMNGYDSNVRAKNIMIAGLSEQNITVGEVELTNDIDKVEIILKEIGVEDITHQNVAEFQYTRIGEPVAEQNRYLKVNVHNKEIRDKIIEKSPALKTMNEPLKKIFINKDTHPVYLKENKRLRKAMKDLKSKPGFEHHTGRVKIIGNELKVDGVTVDKNSFF